MGSGKCSLPERYAISPDSRLTCAWPLHSCGARKDPARCVWQPALTAQDLPLDTTPEKEVEAPQRRSQHVQASSVSRPRIRPGRSQLYLLLAVFPADCDATWQVHARRTGANWQHVRQISWRCHRNRGVDAASSSGCGEKPLLRTGRRAASPKRPQLD
jgi:hypothetical protein